MIAVDGIWEWLSANGFARPKNGVRVDAARHPGNCCRLTVEIFASKCDRCSTRGPSTLVRLMGSCAACASVRDSERRSLRILVNALIPLLREDFEFQNDEVVRENGYSLVRDGVHDNGAVVNIFLKERIDR